MDPIKRGRSARLACERVREATVLPPGALAWRQGFGELG